jgi:hypothetical protein
VLIEPTVGPLKVPPQVPGDGPTVQLSLVLPTYNERRNLEPLIAQISQILDGAISGAIRTDCGG